jgi:hypothetical protein
MQKIYIGNKYIGDAFLGSNSVYPNDFPFIFDTDALLYLNTAGITNEGLKVAVNDFVVDLKDNGLWSKFEDGFIFPFVTDKTVTEDIIDQFKINLVNPTGFTSSFYNPQFGTFSYSGFKSNADTRAVPLNETSASWMIIPFNVSATYGNNTSTHMSFYTNEESTSTVNFDMGAIGPGYYASALRANSIVSVIGNNGLDNVGRDPEKGHLIITHNPANSPQTDTYFNTELIYEYTSNGSFPTIPLFLGRYNEFDGPNAAANQTVSRTYQLATFGVGLNADEVNIFTELVNNLQFNVDSVFSTSRKTLQDIEYLAVGGGGAGGSAWGGGGGAGGFVTGSVFLVEGTSFNVTIGSGGLFSPVNADLGKGGNGEDSIIAFPNQTITAVGGGGGQHYKIYSDLATAGDGGSGGGGGARLGVGGNGTALQGFDGGDANSTVTTSNGGGGGGAGGAGTNSEPSQSGAPGNGGIGKQWLNGSFYAGGGGAGNAPASTGLIGSGGTGGGGNGGNATSGGGTITQPVAGTPNTGGGGGGAHQVTGLNINGANGGSGVVIIRYSGTPVATGGTITQSGGYTYHTFTSDGTFTY